MSDFLSFSVWWILIQLLGLAAWPIGFRLFRWLPDRGYTLIKPLGLLLVSYLVWLSASLHLLPNAPATIAGLALFVTALGWLPAWRRRQDPQGFFAQLRSWLPEQRRLIIAYEMVFIIAFAGWALLRAYNPDVVSGEKIMALSFTNAIQRSPWFPPYDPWLSGYTLPYYYFGHWMIALLSEISGIKTGLIIPLGNALWFGLTTATAFGIVANLMLASGQTAKRAAWIGGVLGAIMVTVMGNWEAPLEVLRAADESNSAVWSWLDIRDLDESYPQPAAGQPRWPPQYEPLGWWWRASRVIHDYLPYTVSLSMSAVTGKPIEREADVSDVIDEFPQFTFLLGEIHAHLLDLPFVLLVLGLALNVYLGGAHGAARSLLKDVPWWPLYPLVIGALGLINSWDLPTYLLVGLAAWGIGLWQAGTLRLWRFLRDALILSTCCVLFYTPYYSQFRLPVGGVWPNLFYGTRASQFLIMFGPFMVCGLLFGLKLVAESSRSGQLRVIRFGLKSVLGGLGLIALIAASAAASGMLTYRASPAVRQWFDSQMMAMAEHHITVGDQLLTRLSTLWVPLSLATAVVAVVLLAWARHTAFRHSGLNDWEPTNFVLLLFAIGLLVTLMVEFAFVLDLERTRANTVFKLYYQAWVLWSIASAYGVCRLLFAPTQIQSKAWRTVTAVIVALSITLGLMYPALAIPTRPDITEPTLDGLAAFVRAPQRASARDTYAVAQWIDQNISGAPVLLEGADGQPGYRVARSRLSAWTGLPIPLGWAYHEQQWRGTDTIQRQRTADIAAIYSTLDFDVALELLKRYHVEYVFVGNFERGLYPAKGLAKFDQMLPLAFAKRSARLYRVP